MGMMAATTTGAVGLSAIDKLSAVIIPFFGVPLTVVTMAAAGAAVSFIHGDKEPDTSAVFKQAIGNAFLALLLVVVVPRMFHMSWVEPGITPPLAALVAWANRWAVPATIKMMPDIVRRLFKLGEYSGHNAYKGVVDREYDAQPLEEKYYEDAKE